MSSLQFVLFCEIEFGAITSRQDGGELTLRPRGRQREPAGGAGPGPGGSGTGRRGGGPPGRQDGRFGPRGGRRFGPCCAHLQERYQSVSVQGCQDCHHIDHEAQAPMW